MIRINDYVAADAGSITLVEVLKNEAEAHVIVEGCGRFPVEILFGETAFQAAARIQKAVETESGARLMAVLERLADNA